MPLTARTETRHYCEWFLDCDGETAATVEHPTLGDVEICGKHLDWLTQDLRSDGSPNPTRMVPPIAARHGRKLRATLAKLDAR